MVVRPSLALSLPLVFLLLPFGLTACGDDDADVPAPSTSDAVPSVEPVGMCTGDELFGRPAANTGLDESQCTDACADCDGGPFVPPDYDEAFVEALNGWTLLDPPAPLTENPYLSPAPEEDPDAVCAVRVEDAEARTYRLETWASAADAAASGAIMTHAGGCGLCSDLGSLAIYAGVRDLTTPVRQCGIQGLVGGERRNLECLADIGFNEACASIWYWNTVNTREECQDLCLRALNDPFHLPDGSLNPCIQCDEDRSGDVFKAVAGRTRRNSGLATALCRPCHEVRPIAHRYE
ncbi:MAG: hypothetical protein EA398_05270 [Deltaproteobacteria bacterium]|nr:MAG: hypothetical protein EA398_05270 [Deltaproteobacteria bacterium]